MIFLLRDIIFSLFGRRDKIEDLSKDANGKGLLERFQELLAGDLDDNELGQIVNLVANTQDPFTLLPKFIAYKEEVVGGLYRIGSNVFTRRKLIAFAIRVISRRATFPGYEMAMRMIGFNTIVLTPVSIVSGFDSPVTFDDANRRFDQRCKTCVDYDLVLTGTLTITSEVVEFINGAVEYNEPYYASLRDIIYNALPLILENISIFGDNVIADFTLPHLLDTQDVFIQVREDTGDSQTVDISTGRPSEGEVTVVFAVAPSVSDDFVAMVRTSAHIFPIIGTGTGTDKTITHTLSTLDVLIQVFSTTGDFETVDVDMKRDNTNDVTVVFNTAPAMGEDYKVILLPSQASFTIVGDNATVEFTVTHSLGTKNVIVQVYSLATGFNTVDIEQQRIDDDNVKIVFGVAPLVADSYRVLVHEN